MNDAIKLLEKKKRYHELTSEGYEAVSMYLDAAMEWERADALAYAISILKAGNKQVT